MIERATHTQSSASFLFNLIFTDREEHTHTHNVCYCASLTLLPRHASIQHLSLASTSFRCRFAIDRPMASSQNRSRCLFLCISFCLVALDCSQLVASHKQTLLLGDLINTLLGIQQIAFSRQFNSSIESDSER